MVLQVLPDPGTIGHHRQAMSRQFRARPDPRQFEQLGRIDRAAGQNDLAPCSDPHLIRPFLVPQDARSVPLEEHLCHQGVRAHLEVRAPHHRLQIGVGRAPAPALAHRHVHPAETLLLVQPLMSDVQCE